MTRTLSANILSEIAKDSNVHPRTLFTIYLDGGPLRFTDHEKDIVFQGNTYLARVVTHTPIKTFFENKVDNCTISIDNTDLAMSAYYAAEEFTGRKAEIRKVFLSSQGGVIDGQAAIPTFSRASIAYNPETGAQVASGVPRYVTGGIFVEEQTANIFSNARMQTATNWNASNSGTLAADSNAADVGGSFPMGNAACLKGTMALGQTNVFINQSLNLSLNTQYTVAFWVFVPSSIPAGNASLNVWYNNSGWNSISSIVIPERNQWALKTLTFTSNTTYAAHVFGVGISGSLSGQSIYACCGQLEQKGYATSFQDPAYGSRVIDNVQVPSSIWMKPVPLSIGVRFFAPASVTDRQRGIFSCTESGGYAIHLNHPSFPNKVVGWAAMSGYVNPQIDIANVALNAWNLAILSISLTKVTLYLINANGIFSNTVSGSWTALTYPAPGRQNLFIGTENNAGTPATDVVFNGPMRDWQFFGKYLTLADVNNMPAANEAAQETPDSVIIKFNGALTSDDSDLRFLGDMDTPKVTEKNLAVRIVSIFDRSESPYPWRAIEPKCNWDFCSPGRCTLNGGVKPRGTASSGTTSGLTSPALAGSSSMVGGICKVLSGTNKGSVRYIATHNTTTGQITWLDNMVSACDATTTFVIECDKSKSTCAGFSNQAHFDGFDEVRSTQNVWATILPQYAQYRSKEIAATHTVIPLIYGMATVQGVLLDEDVRGVNAAMPEKGDRIYAISEGEISSVDSISVNGLVVYSDGVNCYPVWHHPSNPAIVADMALSLYLGTDSQSFDFYGDTKYYRKTAVARIGLYYSFSYSGPAFWSMEGVDNQSDVTRADSFRDIDYRRDVVKFKVRGIKVQKYNADGTPDGAPVWSENPAWCLLDFVMNRSLQPLPASRVNFAKFKAAADVCDALGYRVGLRIDAATTDDQIVNWMLNACRGFLTYNRGQMALNIETTGSVQYAFSMTAGIVNGTFEGPYQPEIKTRPNLIVVNYIDSEIRENMALVTVDIRSGVHITSIPYGDLKGTFSGTGSIHVGQELVPYTANSGTALTVDWTPTRFYQKGYPIFQGEQTFPQESAKYNDFDDQEKKKKVIDRVIDGCAIPTHLQAAQIAEWNAKISIEGAQYCKFMGDMSTLALEVGDIVTISHDVPGWVAEEFRLIEAAESQHEEADYVFRVYDPSFYEQNNHSPNVVLSTTLPNPYAAPGQCANVVVTEGGHVGDDGTYVPNVTVTYDLPASTLFWDHALIMVKVNSGSYQFHGNDTSRGSGYTIDGVTGKFKNGDTVYVKVISVSERGIQADGNSAPTGSHLMVASVITLTAPTGLALEGGGTVWNGNRCSFTWTPQGSGSLDPSYISNEVVIATGGVDRYTFKTKDCRFDYVFGDGMTTLLDNYLIASNGAFTIKVRRVSPLASASSYATLAVTQAAPANPQNVTIQAIARGATLSWDKNNETDFKEYQIRTKITAGGSFGTWIPIRENNFTRMLTASEVTTYGETAGIYFEIKTVDLFGNASSAVASNVAAIGYGVKATDITDFAVTATKQFINTVILTGDTWTDNSPSAGYVAWNSHTLVCNGVLYTIAAGNTNKKYIYWTGPTTYQVSDTNPALADGQFVIATNISGAHDLAWNGIANQVIGSAHIQSLAVNDGHIANLSADKLNAGSIRGINVQSGSFMTKGSYLTSAPSGGATTLNVKDTSDFPTSGSGYIIDTTNDRDAFTWTGKTATSLTGCSGVLAHNSGATIIPAVKGMIIDAAVNEERFYGDPGDGSIKELFAIGDVNIPSGIGAGDYIQVVGCADSGSTKHGAFIRAYSGAGFLAYSHDFFAGYLYSETSAPLILQSNAGSPPTLLSSSYYGALWPDAKGYIYDWVNGLDGVNRWGLIGPRLVAEVTVTGAATASKLISNSLDGNAHGGYDFEFAIVSPAAGAISYYLLINGDSTAANYRRQLDSVGLGSDPIFVSVPGGSTQLVTGHIGITPSGYVISTGRSFGSTTDSFYRFYHRKNATVTNLTQIDVATSDSSSNIGINSRFRLWRCK